MRNTDTPQTENPPQHTHIILALVRLIRPQQWYKNVAALLPLFFAGYIFDESKLILALLATLALCFLSSANYVINDLVDIKRDRAHPEKKNRPLASGQVGIPLAIALTTLFVGAFTFISTYLPLEFIYCGLALFASSQAYTFLLKHEVFADIIAISVNYIIRAIAGAVAISVPVSNWLIVGVFFLALFLATGKRHADLALLGPRVAITHKKTLEHYTPQITNPLLIISTCMLLFTYTLYTFLSNHPTLIYTIPFALYAGFRYFSLVQAGSSIARHPERAITDGRLVASMAIWTILTGGILYYSFLQ